MARTGPRCNQWTGPVRPITPPNKSKNAHEAELTRSKQRKPNEHYWHYETPQKAQLLAIVSWENTKPFRLRARKSEIIKHCEISRTRAYEIIKSGHTRQLAHDFDRVETRGSKLLLLDDQIHKLEQLIWNNGFEGRTITWDSLAQETQVSGRGQDIVSGKIIQRALGQKDWRYCIACRKSYVSPAHARKRLKWAIDMLAKYPKKED